MEQAVGSDFPFKFLPPGLKQLLRVRCELEEQGSDNVYQPVKYGFCGVQGRLIGQAVYQFPVARGVGPDQDLEALK